VVAVAVVTVAALAVPAVPAAATSGTLMIGVDTTLTEDHSGAIEFTADNVTLNCAGYTISGAGGSTSGIRMDGRSGVTVENCAVKNHGSGIWVQSSDGNTFRDNTVTGSGMGLVFSDSDDNEVTRNIVRDGNDWFAFGFVQGSRGNSVTENSATESGAGFAINTGANNNVFERNDASRNVDGFAVFGDTGTVDNTFTDNTAHDNSQFGLTDGTVAGTDPGTAGTENTYTGNTCYRNGGLGSSPVGLCSAGDTVGLVDPATGEWSLRNSVGTVTSFFYGNPGDLPIAGDWDGDGVATPGLYRQSDGFLYSRNSNTTGVADAECFAGDPSDVPIAGDWDGDGDDNLGIYRPSEQRFYLFTTTCTGTPMGAAQISFLFGNPGDNPVAGDWDGDGIDEVGLHRESTGFFYWRNTLDTGVADGEIFFGDPGDRFVSGDWGVVDGKDTPGLFRPSDVTFYFRHTLTQGVADSQFTWTGAGSSWLPVAGDFGLG
jgi:parallel beta-helix repeat protein